MTKVLFVLDSWPVMEWLKAREPVATRFDELIDLANLGRAHLLMSTINLGEVYYLSWKEWGPIRADEIRTRFERLPVRILNPTKQDVLAAARIKAQHHFPYADAFAVVLALDYGGSIITGDPDFRRLSGAGTVSIQWWGK